VIRVDREQAEEQLDHLIEAAAAGQEVVITTAGGAAVRLVPFPQAQAEQEHSATSEPATSVGHSLDRFIGNWSAEDEAELLEAIEVFEQVDESFWR
jgi:antitoxin (DNA-binding transcriptional repressor) of toxin-antitoxin stability system